MISELTLAMTHKVPLEVLAETVHCYPTQAEVFQRVALQYRQWPQDRGDRLGLRTGQATRHNRHLAERMSPRTMTDEGGLQKRSRIMRALEFMGLDGSPRPVPGAREVLVVLKAAVVGPWHRLVRD
jgi:hypothetical protein